MRASSLADRQKLALELLGRVKTELADKRPAPAEVAAGSPNQAAPDSAPAASPTTDPNRAGRVSRNV